MSFPHYSQLEYSDCGATCLKIILKYYNKKSSLGQLRDLCETTRAGVSVGDLVNAANKLRFETVSLLCTSQWLIENAVLPCIIHWKQDHFVVLYKITDKYFYISDPAFGKIRLKHDVFANWWKEDAEKGIALFLEPKADFNELQLVSSTFKERVGRSFSYFKDAVKDQHGLIGALLLIIIFSSAIIYVFPKTMQTVIDKGIQRKNVTILWSVLGFQLALIFGQNLFNWIQGWVRVKFSMRISVKMITQLLLKVIRLPVRFFDSRVPTDIFQRIEDQKNVELFISEQLIQTIVSVVLTIVLTVRLFGYNTDIGCIFSILSIVSVSWVFMFYRLRRQLDYTNFRLNSENHNLVNEIIHGMVDVKVNNAQDKKISQWKRLQTKIFVLKNRVLQLGVYQNIGVQLLTQLKNVFITFLCAYLVIKGQLSIGTMLSIGYITGLLSNPIDSLANFSRTIQDAQLSLTRLDEIMQRKNEVIEDAGYLDVEPMQKIELRNVSFKYEGSSQPYVLSDINIEIPIGKVTAIVGSSGSGKSTIFKLLLNFYTPQKGNILIDETNFELMNPEKWREQCGIVLQDGYIFSGTFADNIAVGDTQPDMEKLINAARIACLIGFIEKLPLQFNTKIGNTGMGLSGGQKQRLLIARAIYKNPKYLFLDEATSSLDSNNERQIMQNLDEFFKGRTVVIIAHRLSTVKNADQIIVIENGRLEETGHHRELTRVKGKYFQLVKNQLELGN
jgi:ATP-binding cassette subfamily B protein